MSQSRRRRADRRSSSSKHRLSRYRRSPRIESLEQRAMAGEMLTGVLGIAFSLKKQTGETAEPFQDSAMYRNGDGVDLWISPPASNQQVLLDSLWAASAAGSASPGGVTSIPAAVAAPVEAPPVSSDLPPMPNSVPLDAEIFPLILDAPSASNAAALRSLDASDTTSGNATLSMQPSQPDDTGSFAASATTSVSAESDTQALAALAASDAPTSLAASLAAGASSGASTSDASSADSSSASAGGGAAAQSASALAAGALAGSGGGADSWGGGDQFVVDGGGGFTQYVVNWNDGLTLSPAAIEYQSEGDSVDLRAQVVGKQVASYSWDTSAAPTAGNISGTSTYQLKLRWNNIFSGNTVDNRIRLTVNYTDLTQSVTDYNFRVINDGTASGSGGGTPVSATWSEALSPDRLAGARDAVAGDRYTVDSVGGQLDVFHSLPSYGPAGVPLALVYNSESAAPKPIFLDHYQLRASAHSGQDGLAR